MAGFFGDSIRFRTSESAVNELLLLKARAREEGGQIAVEVNCYRYNGIKSICLAAKFVS